MAKKEYTEDNGIPKNGNTVPPATGANQISYSNPEIFQDYQKSLGDFQEELNGLYSNENDNPSTQTTKMPQYESYSSLVNEMWKNRPDEYTQKDQKRLRSKAIAAGLTDAFTNLANLYYTTQGAPNQGGSNFLQPVVEEGQKQKDAFRRARQERFKTMQEAAMKDLGTRNAWNFDVAKQGMQEAAARRTAYLQNIFDTRRRELDNSFQRAMATAKSNDDLAKAIADRDFKLKAINLEQQNALSRISAQGAQTRMTQKESQEFERDLYENGYKTPSGSSSNKQSIVAANGEEYRISNNRLYNQMVNAYFLENKEKWKNSNDPSLATIATIGDFNGLDTKQKEKLIGQMATDPTAVPLIQNFSRQQENTNSSKSGGKKLGLGL